MQLHGRRRVRSGHPGSDRPPVPVMSAPPAPAPKTIKGIRWLDHTVHHERGHSSYLDLEKSQCPSILVQDDKTGRIDGTDTLWYKDADYEEQRRVVKSEFFRRLGEDEEVTVEASDKVDPSWNRLTAYSGHLKKLKPRSHNDKSDESSDSSETPALSRSDSGDLPTMMRRINSNTKLTDLSRTSPVDSLMSFNLEGTPSFSTPRDGSRRNASPSDPAVGLDHFVVHGLVGEGAFGKVMMATKIDTQKVYAMKVIRKALLFDDATRVSQAITEKQVLQQMAARPHPYVISLRYAFQTEDNICLVMDLVGGGDLFQLLEAKRRLPEAWVRTYAAEVCLALEHVHAHDVIFRDLKPENVMIGVDGHLKLTDFGLSKQLHDDATGTGKKRNTTQTICGTPEYIAPEVLQGLPYGSAVDWWTYGCLVYEMVHGNAPFRSLDMGSLVLLITRGKISFKSEFCSPTLEDMLRKLLVVKADMRLGTPALGGATGIKEHAFFRELDWDALLRKEVASPCALSELFTDSVPPSTTKAQRQDRLRTEFTDFAGHDDDEEAELSRIAPPTPATTQAMIGDAHSSARGSPKDSTSSTDNENSRRASLNAEVATGDSSMSRPNSRSRFTPVPMYEPSSATLSLELTRTGSIWAISHSLARALGYTQKQPLLGRSMLDAATSLVEADTLMRFGDAFEKARDALDDELAQQVPSTPKTPFVVRRPSVDGEEVDEDDEFTKEAAQRKLADVTVWLIKAGGGRLCVQASFETVVLDASYSDTGGPAGLVTLTMIDVTVAEHNKELVSRRYELAYNAKAKDQDLIEFFASHVEESKKSVPVPGYVNRLPTPTEGGAPDEMPNLSSGVRAYLVRRRALLRAFPDLHFTMLEQTTQGESVYTSWQWVGTHLGPYPVTTYQQNGLKGDVANEIAPSGARVHVHGISIDVFERGKIVDHSVFYDEAAIRAQVELKAAATHGRDTRSILRRAHELCVSRESQFNVQLHLSVRKGARGDHAHVNAMMKTVLVTAPRYSERELAMMSTMENFYASKAITQLAVFANDGFCLCDGGPADAPPRPASTSAAPPTSIILCSRAFARVLHLPSSVLLRADVYSVLEPVMRLADPDVAVRLATALAEQEPFHAVFEGHVDNDHVSSASAANAPATDVAVPQPSDVDSESGVDKDGGRENAQKAEDSESSKPARIRTPTRAPGRVFTLDAAPFKFERRLYWSIILSDLSDDLCLHNVDLDGRQPPVAVDAGSPHLTSSSPRVFNQAGIKRPSVGTRRGGNRPSDERKTEVADHFVHCLPSSWRWFGGKTLLKAITAAMHACCAALSLSDLKGEDAPLVWITEGFTRLNGWARIEAIGRNCRFLQSDASDFAPIHEMRNAISARRHTRVYLWNEAQDKEGFWTVLSLMPGNDARGNANGTDTAVADPDTHARYMMGVQTRLTKSEMSFVFERLIAYRTAFWQPRERAGDAAEILQMQPGSQLGAARRVVGGTAGGGVPAEAAPSPPAGQASAAPIQAIAAPAANEPATPSSVPTTKNALTAALKAWQSEYEGTHGRRPTPAEASAMVLEAYATLMPELT